MDGFNRISGNANIKTKINISDVIKNGNLISDASDAYTLTSELCNALFAQVPDSDRINYFMNSKHPSLLSPKFEYRSVA